MAGEAADPVPGIETRPSYLSLDDVPRPATYLADPGVPTDPDPFSLDGVVMTNY